MFNFIFIQSSSRYVRSIDLERVKETYKARIRDYEVRIAALEQQVKLMIVKVLP